MKYIQYCVNAKKKPYSNSITWIWKLDVNKEQISRADATERLLLGAVAGYKTVYPKVSGLAAWSENCKWYSSLSLGAVVSLFYESV
jgi:hypothetical protein